MKSIKVIMAVALSVAAIGGAYAGNALPGVPGNDSLRMAGLISRAIYCNDERIVRNIGNKQSGIEFTLRSIYAHQNLFYLHTQIKNTTNTPVDIECVRMQVVDKQPPKGAPIEGFVIFPQQYFNGISRVRGGASERTVWAIDKISLPDDKVLQVVLFGKNSGLRRSFTISGGDLAGARGIEGLRLE